MNPEMRARNDDYSNQRPNIENPLQGKQYPANFLSYIDFCKVLADCEEMKDYVFLNFDEATVQRINGKQAADEKPIESYALMIFRALDSSAEGRLTLSEIYSWIEMNYPYYQTADPVWKNSIRHNLSLNPTFKKVPRPANSKGKGGFWEIDPSQRQGQIMKNRRPKSQDSQFSDDILNLNAGRMIF